jgi:hypothetical protein
MVAPWKGSNGSTEDDIRTDLNVRYVETGKPRVTGPVFGRGIFRR